MIEIMCEWVRWEGEKWEQEWEALQCRETMRRKDSSLQRVIPIQLFRVKDNDKRWWHFQWTLNWTVYYWHSHHHWYYVICRSIHQSIIHSSSTSLFLNHHIKQCNALSSLIFHSIPNCCPFLPTSGAKATTPIRRRRKNEMKWMNIE